MLDTIETARRFIKNLAGNSLLTWQTFDDRKKDESLKGIFHGRLDKLFVELTRRNERGAGVFVAVNETDGKGRSKRNIIKIRALFLDLDGTPLPDPAEWGPTPPHIITETSAGRFHCLWRISDCPLNKFETYQLALADRFGGDPSVKTIERCVRVPGFFHHKDEPFLSRIITTHDKEPYKLAAVRSGLKLVPKPVKKEDRTINEPGKLVPKGERHEYLKTTGSQLHKAGLRGRLFVDTLRSLYATNCEQDPPLAPNEIEDLEKWFAKRSAGPTFRVGRHFRPMPIVNHILTQHRLVSINGDLYRWTREAGHYQPWAKDQLTRLYVDLLGDDARTHHIREIRDLLIDQCAKNPDEIDPLNLLCIENGVVDYQTGELLDHTPDLILTSRFPVRLDPDAKCPQYDEFSRKALPDPKQRDFMHEICAYTLQRDARFQTAFLLYDNDLGSTGKSTYGEILQRLLGPGRYRNVPLHRLADRFQTAELARVHANISSEVNVKEYLDDAMIKQIISAEEITVERKHRDPMTIKPHAKIIVTANKFPLTRDSGDAFFRRWQILVFEHQFPKPGERGNKPRFAQTLPQSEINGIFFRVLEGMVRLRKNEGFTVPESSVEALCQYRLASNPVADFASQFLYEDGTSRGTTVKAIHEEYKRWCAEEECMPLSYRKFKDALPRVMKVKPVQCPIRNQLILPSFAVMACANRATA